MHRIKNELNKLNAREATLFEFVYALLPRLTTAAAPTRILPPIYIRIHPYPIYI